ncbi:MAG: sporulation protein YabP [Defluviitaleaceae bacterium]|nr:sporulation protein YabP [Defluviitaleaceae bacterium]
MPDDKKTGSKHSVTLERRENISVSGVLDVISFDEDAIVIDTELGILILKGVGLHVNRLNLDTGELEVDGDIVSLNYEEGHTYGKNKPMFLGKLFK